jgi:CubicO group peptidase (beta-lactamase class C family)
MKKRTFVLMIIVVVGTAVASAAGPLDDLPGYVDGLLAEFSTPGAAVIVVTEGSGPLISVHGVRSFAGGEPVTSHTPFNLGSVSKSFTAALAAAYVGDNLIDWDIPVREVLPEFRLQDGLATERATLRDLLAHRTGMGRNSTLMFNVAEGPSWILPRLSSLEAHREFRDRFRYSNVMYAVAGAMLERKMKTSWPELMRRRLLVPIEMLSTGVGLDDKRMRNAARPHVITGDDVFEIEISSSAAGAPAAGLWSTASDMRRWLQFLLDGGAVADRIVVEREPFLEGWKPQIAIRRLGSADEPMKAYGFGWYISTMGGHRVMTHEGAGPGYQATVAVAPDAGVAVAVLANAALTPVPDLVQARVLESLLGLERSDLRERARLMMIRMDQMKSQALESALAEQDPSSPLPLDPSAYAGTYSDPVYGDVDVAQTKEGLAVAYHGYWLETIHLRDNAVLLVHPLFDQLRCEFVLSYDGQVVGLEIPIAPRGGVVTFSR